MHSQPGYDFLVSDIMMQFLVEAVVLALIGGVAGALTGIGAIAGLGGSLGWPMKVDPLALGIAVATSALTGIAFVFFPARRAAKLDPIVALRHEQGRSRSVELLLSRRGLD